MKTKIRENERRNRRGNIKPSLRRGCHLSLMSRPESESTELKNLDNLDRASSINSFPTDQYRGWVPSGSPIQTNCTSSSESFVVVM